MILLEEKASHGGGFSLNRLEGIPFPRRGGKLGGVLWRNKTRSTGGEKAMLGGTRPQHSPQEVFKTIISGGGGTCRTGKRNRKGKKRLKKTPCLRRCEGFTYRQKVHTSKKITQSVGQEG